MSFEEGADLNASHCCREWLAAVLGNTHVRWGWFVEETLVKVERFPAHQPLSWPQQTELWLAPVGSAPLPPASPWVHQLELSQVPLRDPYPGLGLDRALALWAAGIHYGWPCLVIDAGTALTLTGADCDGSLVGGGDLARPGVAGAGVGRLHCSAAQNPLGSLLSLTPPLGQRHRGCHPQRHPPHPLGWLARVHCRLASPLSPRPPAADRRGWEVAPPSLGPA